MNEIQRMYERYKHLDDALSDSDWCQEGWRSAAAYDLWAAIKAEHERQQAEATNPYPEDIFPPMDLKMAANTLVTAGISPDRVFGNFGRDVWNNCREATLREVGEWLGAIAGDISHSAVVGPQEIDMLKSGHMPGESDG